MKKGHKLCGKGYDSCSTCPYGDKDCEGNKYYNLCLDDVTSALSKITDKESEYRVALEAIIETMAQPIDRISNVDVISYGALRKIVLDIATKALKVINGEII